MKVCTECNSSEADEAEQCKVCGAELRKRSISEAVIDLLSTSKK